MWKRGCLSFFEENHVPAVLRKQSCRSRARRTATDYQHVTSFAASLGRVAHPACSALNDLENNTRVMP